MPKVKSLASVRYEPRPQIAKPLSKTPYDQTKARPSTEKRCGAMGGLCQAEKKDQGDVNLGGRRRPGHNARYGID